MATTKVSALSAKTSLAGSEELLISDGGTSKKVTATNLLAGAVVGTGDITTDKIADDAVTADKLANSINSEIAANTAKVTNATHTGDVTGATALTIAADAVTTAKIADDAVTADKLANSINSEIAANTAKVTNATHTGEVTGATTLTIADNVVDEANLKISNTPTNGYVLTAQSGNTGGLTWAEISSGNTTANGMWEHAHTIASNYSITSGNNAIAAGPITINSGVSVTVPTGSTWVIA